MPFVVPMPMMSCFFWCLKGAIRQEDGLPIVFAANFSTRYSFALSFISPVSLARRVEAYLMPFDLLSSDGK